MFRPRWSRKTHACSKQTALVESGITWGRSSTLGFISTLSAVSTLGEIRPGLGRRRKRKDLHLEGGRQHRAWARDGRVKPLYFGQGSFIFVGKTVPLADPLQIHIIVGSEHSEGLPNAVMQRLAESAAHMATQGLQATLGELPEGTSSRLKTWQKVEIASDMATWSASFCSAAWASALADSLRADSNSANSQNRILQTRVEE
jgi:hypothetical protein